MAHIHAVGNGRRRRSLCRGQLPWRAWVPAGAIARWDGATWSCLGQGQRLNGPVSLWRWATPATSTPGAGSPRRVGWPPTTSPNGMAALGRPWAAGWNGNVVYALAVDGAGNLYAGGEFTTAGGVTANNIAKWDGSAWSALGCGMDDIGLCLGGGRHRRSLCRGLFHHGRRGQRQPHRQMGRHGLVVPGQRHE